jgi:cytoskeletal protein CcmA (bactofilin family)
MKQHALTVFLRRPLWIGLVLALMLLAVSQPLMAQGPVEGDRVLLGKSLYLGPGEVRRGDVVIIGGDLRMEPESTLEGDVAVIGGNATVAGTVMGDVAMVNGALDLKATAVVQGDVISIGGTLSFDSRAVVRGSILNGFAPRIDMRLPLGPERPISPLESIPPRPRPWDWLMGFLLNGLTAVAWATLMAVLGVLLVVAFPQPAGRVAQTMREGPLLAFGVGLLVQALALPVLAFLTITICLAPLALLMALVLVAAWLYGWLVVGWRIGQWLAQALNARQSTPILEMAVGVILLTLLWRLPRVIPCLGWLVSVSVLIVAGSIGLGAVLLTRFGTQLYRPGAGPGGPRLPVVTREALPEGERPTDSSS